MSRWVGAASRVPSPTELELMRFRKTARRPGEWPRQGDYNFEISLHFGFSRGVRGVFLECLPLGHEVSDLPHQGLVTVNDGLG